MKINDLVRHLKYFRDQDEFGLLYHSRWKPLWEVMDFTQIFTYPAKDRAGLQLADCAASAFYAALETTAQSTVKPEFAKALLPRMALSKNDRIYDFGFKVWPVNAPTIVSSSQREILNFYMDDRTEKRRALGP